jgi:hypothetical protein
MSEGQARRLARDELVALVRRIIVVEGTEAELDGWIDLLGANVPHPEPSGLIFYAKRPMTAEEIVDAALG